MQKKFLIYAFRACIRRSEPHTRCGVFFVGSMNHVTFLRKFRSVAGVAVPSNLSTTRARFYQTQIQEQLCTTGRSCTVSLALDTIPLRRMIALEVTLLLCLQRCAITVASGSHIWPWIYVKLRPAGRSCQRMGLELELCGLQASKQVSTIQILFMALKHA